ncbi:MAG: hypothetical protein V3G42_13120 [Oscillospiraceae bacterium]
MSREVEVQNIQMTATVPEDIQISLGKIGTDNSTASTADTTSLAKNAGYLVTTATDVVAVPREGSEAYNAIDWSNTVDISHYYNFGRLIPASSDTGANIFFTPDANGIGQTVKTDAKYYTAVNAVTPVSENAVGGDGSGTLNATAHVVTSTAWTNSGTGTRAVSWKSTNDDGYYIDIPVWLRTSSTDGASVKVKAYVVDRNTITGFGTDTSGTTTSKELYRAVRVAILDKEGATAAASGTGNLIEVADGNGILGSGSGYAGGSILDWYSAGGSSGTVTNPYTVHGGAVSTVSEQGTTNPSYTTAPSKYNGTSAVATLPAGQGNVYGISVKRIIRVWLEGEDPDCYNETAGQDWSINLMFEKIE